MRGVFRKCKGQAGLGQSVLPLRIRVEDHKHDGKKLEPSLMKPIPRKCKEKPWPAPGTAASAKG